MATNWRNRIVGHGEISAGDLLANPRNWRIHPKPQQDALKGVLNEVGWVQTVMINKRTSPEWGADQFIETMVDGHLRVSLALREGEATLVPFDYVDLTPHEEALILATLDPLSALAVTDKEQLDALLREVSTGEAAVQEMLAELAMQYDAYGDTSNDRDGQGVSSTWDQVDSAENERVVIGDIETRLPGDVVETLKRLLTERYERQRVPVFETLEAVIVAGVRAVESCDS